MASRLKKTAHAEEQRPPDVLEQRRDWLASQLDLDPANLVFVDETSASTSLARTHGRCRRGRRLPAAVPHGHYKTVTLVAGLRLRGLAAPSWLAGAGELSLETRAYVIRNPVDDWRSFSAAKLTGDAVFPDSSCVQYIASARGEEPAVFANSALWPGPFSSPICDGRFGIRRAEMSESICDNPNRSLSHAGVAIGDFALDPRPSSRGRQAVRFCDGVAHSILGMVAGANSYRQMHEFIRIRLQRLNEAFGLRLPYSPSYTGLRLIIQGVDPAALEAAFRQHASSISAPTPLDGL